MPALPVDASKFAGISEEQARTFPARTVVGAELSDAQIAAMPQMISTDAHVMEPDALWQELTPRLREHLPKVPFRNCPPGASDPRLRVRDQDTDGVAAEILFPNYGMALFGIDDIETQQESFKVYNDWMHEFCSTDPKRLYGVPLVPPTTSRPASRRCSAATAWASKEQCCGKCRTRACHSPRNITSRYGQLAPKPVPRWSATS
jgi:hypothetical protein